MTSNRQQHGTVRCGAFTLLEILAAVSMSATVLAALVSVSFGTVRLRERRARRFEDRFVVDYAVRQLRDDLTGIVVPAGLLAGPMLGEPDESGAVRLDRLEFFSTSLPAASDAPWGDIAFVSYYLEEAEDGVAYTLVRAIDRNLLAEVAEEPEEDVLLAAVDSLEISYFDGETWVDSWDSTTVENELPRAISVRLELAQVEEAETAPAPVELTIEVLPQVLPSETETDGAQTGAGDGQGGMGL